MCTSVLGYASESSKPMWLLAAGVLLPIPDGAMHMRLCASVRSRLCHFASLFATLTLPARQQLRAPWTTFYNFSWTKLNSLRTRKLFREREQLGYNIDNVIGRHLILF